MKTRLLLLCLLMASYQIYAQCPGGTPDPGYTCIPDGNFEQALIDQMYDSEGTLDGQVLTADISGITSLDISSLGITDLTGIEDFTSLTSLTARFNNVSTVDLSSNTSLDYLDLFENSLIAIDVSANTALRVLDLGSFDKNGKHNMITEINVSSNTLLETLGVAFNELDNLNVSSNTALKILGCAGNNLTILDVSSNTGLTRLTCSGNSIGSLNLTNNTNLDSIICDNNTGMTTLTLPPSAPLTRIDCYSNNNTGMLSGTLDVSMFSNLEVLWCYGNNFSGNLNLVNNTVLENVDIGQNNFTGVTMPDDLDTLFRFICDNNSISNLNLVNNEALTTLWCNDANIDTLILPNSVTGSQLDVWCSGNNLTSLDVSGLSNLRKLWCYGNNLDGIDVSNNPALILLDCGINPFTSGLNVSSNSNLQELYCNNNNLTDIDLSSNGALNYFGIYNNNGDPYHNDLTSLNLGSNTALMWASCGRNPNLSNVTLPNTASLKTFWCYTNSLTNLDFLNPVNYANMEYFDVGNGNLTSIDVSTMPNLIEFYCNNNTSLSYLNIQNGFNENLEWMWAHNTNLSCIQVDNVTDAYNKNTNNWRRGAAEYSTSCPALSTDDFVFKNLTIYPNPTRNTINMQLASEASYSIVNIMGKVVDEGVLGSGMNAVDLSHTANGIYFLTLSNPEGRTTKKIMKQ
ncbi:T9SS type A sorting domain-containing protein [Aestuariivivens sediminicola]|uniref:T9SS type A sorting domain-containing protein n=1 Tax=Aestuariivivens sediminicola TaxID=2913560 RepID=UPI001F593471|nr:T9SS type A sorting domain-containing protein [Aestuariivivens sediminicola]